MLVSDPASGVLGLLDALAELSHLHARTVAAAYHTRHACMYAHRRASAAGIAGFAAQCHLQGRITCARGLVLRLVSRAYPSPREAGPSR